MTVEGVPPSDGSTAEVPVWAENASVVRAYSELELSRTVGERVAVLERLYRDGWEDAVKAVDEEVNRAAEEREEECLDREEGGG